MNRQELEKILLDGYGADYPDVTDQIIKLFEPDLKRISELEDAETLIKLECEGVITRSVGIENNYLVGKKFMAEYILSLLPQPPQV